MAGCCNRAKMYSILICLLVICVNRHSAAVCSQHTGYKCENGCENVTQTGEHVAAVTSADTGTFAFWSADFTNYLGSRQATRNAWDVWQKICNSRLQLKLNVYKNNENDTFVNVRLADKAAEESENRVGRTFGIRRRMQLFLFLPISFKLGVIVTLLLVLTTMSLKTLIVAFVILLLLLSHTNSYSKLWGAAKTAELSDSHRNVHIHVHTLPLPEDHHHPYVEPWHGSSPAAVYHV